MHATAWLYNSSLTVTASPSRVQAYCAALIKMPSSPKPDHTARSTQQIQKLQVRILQTASVNLLQIRLYKLQQSAHRRTASTRLGAVVTWEHTDSASCKLTAN